MKRYDAVMRHIQVTQAMHARILHELAGMALQPRPKPARLFHFKKYLSIAACLLLLLVGMGVLSHLFLFPSPANPPVQAVPDMVHCASPSELAQTVGFASPQVRALPFHAETVTYMAYWHELAQVTYSGEGQTAVIRKAFGSEDISGDFSAYTHTEKIALGTGAVTLKGTEGSYTLALWTNEEFSYSLKLSKGLSKEDWVSVLAEAA